MRSDETRKPREASFIKSNTVGAVPMVIKWRDCVNIGEPRRKGHSIFAPPQRGRSRCGELLTHVRAAARHRRPAGRRLGMRRHL